MRPHLGVLVLMLLWSIAATIYSLGAGCSGSRPDFRSQLDHLLPWIGLPVGVACVCVSIYLIRRHYTYRARIESGCCAHCGYDLQGIADRRCPECGSMNDGSRVGQGE